MSTYAGSGHAYLVCPALIAEDARHAEHWSRFPPCRRGRACQLKHDHESPLEASEGHTVNDFYWFPGCRPPTEEEWPVCDLCGARLVHADLDHPLDQKHLVGVLG